METDPTVLMQRIAIKVDDPEQSVKNVSIYITTLHAHTTAGDCCLLPRNFFVHVFSNSCAGATVS